MLYPTIITDARSVTPLSNVTAEYRTDNTDPADTEADLTIAVHEQNDGGTDVARWAESVLHVQIDTTTENGPRGIVVHLNDGDPIYQGDPEQHDDAAAVLRQVRKVLSDSSNYGGRGPAFDALNLLHSIVITPSVIL